MLQPGPGTSQVEATSFACWCFAVFALHFLVGAGWGENPALTYLTSRVPQFQEIADWLTQTLFYRKYIF